VDFSQGSGRVSHKKSALLCGKVEGSAPARRSDLGGGGAGRFRGLSLLCELSLSMVCMQIGKPSEGARQGSDPKSKAETKCRQRSANITV
jgi:hypothetical protein